MANSRLLRIGFGAWLMEIMVASFNFFVLIISLRALSSNLIVGTVLRPGKEN